MRGCIDRHACCNMRQLIGEPDARARRPLLGTQEGAGTAACCWKPKARQGWLAKPQYVYCVVSQSACRLSLVECLGLLAVQLTVRLWACGRQAQALRVKKCVQHAARNNADNRQAHVSTCEVADSIRRAVRCACDGPTVRIGSSALWQCSARMNG